MLKKICAMSCLSFAAVGLVSLPAQADTAVIQRNTQETYVGGQRNISTQVSEQVNIHRSSSRVHHNSDIGVVQDTYQGSVLDGERNDAYQRSQQINVIQKNGPRSRHHRPNIYIEQK